MLAEVIVRLVDRQRWLDQAGDVLGKAAKVFDQLGPLSSPVEDLLHGTPAGHPLHPALTDIPIGAWTATLALDLADIQDGADFTLNLGLTAAVFTAISGLADWRYLHGTQRRVGVAHALFNIAGTTLYGLSSFQRRSGNRASAKTLSNLGYVLILSGGFLGGDMAYHLGIMVNRNAWLMGEQPWTPAMPLVDLADETPTRATANGQELVLVRRGEQVFALANVCAHLGGPLSQGEIKDDCIVCPWHGSHFALENGHVKRGPSAYNQPFYATRVHNGIVEVQLVGEPGDREP
jgi:nitrite reductase/ring-hydroxylating ferredoxin subunit/uncharacterized membrane protein